MRRIQPVLRRGVGVDRLEVAADLPVHDCAREHLQVERLAQVLRLLDHAPRDVEDDPRLVARGRGGDDLRPRLRLIAQAIEQDRRGQCAFGVLARHCKERAREPSRSIERPKAEQVDQEKDVRRVQHDRRRFPLALDVRELLDELADFARVRGRELERPAFVRRALAILQVARSRKPYPFAVRLAIDIGDRLAREVIGDRDEITLGASFCPHRSDPESDSLFCSARR